MIFIDTGAFVGRHVSRDQHHDQAVEVWEHLAHSDERCLTSTFVVDESMTLIGLRAGHRLAAEVGRRIYTSRALELLRPDADDELRALALFEKYEDQKVSFTDCVSFALMERRRIARAFTFDRDFRRAGFETVPGAVGG